MAELAELANMAEMADSQVSIQLLKHNSIYKYDIIFHYFHISMIILQKYRCCHYVFIKLLVLESIASTAFNDVGNRVAI